MNMAISVMPIGKLHQKNLKFKMQSQIEAVFTLLTSFIVYAVCTLDAAASIRADIRM